MEKVLGRVVEKKLLDEVLMSGEPELVALFGRRRVGKTFLIRQYLKESIVFEFVGSKDLKLRSQLEEFTRGIGGASGNEKLFQTPKSWPEAFELLTYFLTPKLASGRSVVFLDEFPWLNTRKSGFLSAFDHWWNSWGNKQENLVVIICGSAASWMIKNVVNNKGGLHNRITKKIRLLPFTLSETEQFLQSRNIQLERYQILQIFMVMGGIPHYLKEIKKGESSVQAIDRICFSKDGLLAVEFKNLYYSLFEDPKKHLAVVRALAANNAGLTRGEIIKKTKSASGGTKTELLDELIESGFVTAWHPYDKKSKDSIYKLADEFTHFYFKFIEGNRAFGDGVWLSFFTSPSWKSWSGVAFERVCLKHLQAIKNALGIATVYTEVSTWRYLPKKGSGAQIDLLLDRKDFVVNLCEMKFSETEFTLDKGYVDELKNKAAVFKAKTKMNKPIYLTLITTFGLKDNEYAKRDIYNSVTMKDLFI